jgi:hypothetical protein
MMLNNLPAHIVQQREKYLPKVLSRNISGDERTRDIGLGCVMRVELRRDALDAVGIQGASGGGNSAPPPVSDRAAGKDNDVTPAPVVRDLGGIASVDLYLGSLARIHIYILCVCVEYTHSLSCSKISSTTCEYWNGTCKYVSSGDESGRVVCSSDIRCLIYIAQLALDPLMPDHTCWSVYVCSCTFVL